jgi:hypothetical protein
MLKQLLRPIALALLWASVGLACKKEEVATCDPKDCCSNSEYKFVQDLDGAKADISSIGFTFEQPIMGQRAILACQYQWDKMGAYEKTADWRNPDPPYKYRVWGKVYHNTKVWNIGPPYEKLDVYFTRIEKVK